MLTEMKIVPYPEITERDVQDIEKAITSDCLGMDLETVHETIQRGDTILWRYTSDEGRAVILTQVTRGTKESELFLWYLGGIGLKPNGHYVTAVLEEYCRLNNLQRVTALVKKGVHRFLRPFGYDIDRYLVSKEIS